MFELKGFLPVLGPVERPRLQFSPCVPRISHLILHLLFESHDGVL